MTHRSKKKPRRNQLEVLEQRQLLAADFLITEFVASNGSSLIDGNGNSSDWIEIRNVGDTAGSLQGWFLTDDFDELDQWEFPASPESQLAPGEFVVVFASGDNVPDSSGSLHTNFALSAGGEFLGLVRPDGQIANQFGSATEDYPAQQQDISFGIDDSVAGGNPNRFFVTPTPNQPNGVGVEGFVSDTSFSLDRGFYSDPIIVDVTSATEGATIVYTTDGSEPTLANGTAVTAASGATPVASVSIDTTTVLRAAAFKSGFLDTNVDTQTYLFLDDVASQPDDPAGFPERRGADPRVPIDYEVDPDIVGTATGRADVIAALTALPTLSLTSDLDNIFGPDGLYSNTQVDGLEFGASAELFSLDDGTEFQIDAGLRIAGGSSRNPNLSPKQSFSLRFRSAFGASRLEHPLFADSPVDEFNSLQLRAVYNNSWIHFNDGQRSRGTLIRDQFVRDSFIALGNEDGGRGKFVNLYLNGLYWGIYNLHERGEASHYAAYNGGDDDQLDALNGGVAVDGTLDSFQALRATVNARDWDGVNERLDVDNFIDWTILNGYIGNADLRANQNWRAAGGGPDGAKWRFYPWDSERSLEGLTDQPPGDITDATGLFTGLSQIPEFVVRFGDRLHLHFSEGGALQPAAVAQRWNARVAELDQAIVAESARWGDFRAPNDPFTREADWVVEIERLVTTYFPDRSDFVIDQYRSLGLLPSIDAPQTLIDGNLQIGGDVQPGSELSFQADQGTVFYTLDGSDPRLPGGAINPDAIALDQTSIARTLVSRQSSWNFEDSGQDLGTSWRTPSFNDSSWSSGNAQLGYGEGDEATVVSFGPDSGDRHVTTYFRRAFSVDQDFDSLTLRLKVDDGAVVYINGTEATRVNLPAGPINFGTGALDAAANDGNDFITIPIDAGLLVPGENVIAVEVHQVRSRINGQRTGPVTSSDLSFDAELLATADAPTGPAQSIILNDSVQINTRARADDGEWSALQSGEFLVATEPADVTNLRITEINYNPHDATDLELLALPGVAGGDFEFIEIMNLSNTVSISLAGLSLANAVTFEFGDAVLAPGQRAVVVEDVDAFAVRYADAIDSGVTVLGSWSGALNDSGEEIEVVGAGGELVFSVEYQDSDPWDFIADGNGGTLSLIDPVGTPVEELSKYYRWSSEAVYGGSPGAAAAEPSGVIVNEVLAHTDLPDVDSIELRNTSDVPIDISGWWLSDDGQVPLKFQIPTTPPLAPGALIVFDATDFGGDGNVPGQIGFGLSASEGEEVFLTQSIGGVVTRIEDAVEFGATFNGVSLGRTPDESRLVPLRQNSLGQTNGVFAFADLVISEVNYHPVDPNAAAVALNSGIIDDDLEFIEVTNRSGNAIELTNWRVRGEVDFDFAAGQNIQPGQSLVLVSFDPANVSLAAAFRAHFGASADTELVGPFDGGLSNSSGLVRLQQPDDPPADNPSIQPHINVDEFVYDDLAPWPVSADGDGDSINRIGPSTLAAFAGSWIGATPSPGSVLVAPSIASVQINAGLPTRSEVTSLTVQFESVVEVDSSHFELTNQNGQEIGGLIVDTVNNQGRTTATITFASGPQVISGLDAGLPNTLIDGNYQLRYRLDGFGEAANRVDTFFRQYGDATGDNTVGLGDFALFRAAFGQPTGDDGLDANRDGEVNLADFAAFRSAFGTVFEP